ncbi:MAG: hypothetical protein ACK4NE_09370 [Albidovulum sp.]
MVCSSFRSILLSAGVVFAGFTGEGSATTVGFDGIDDYDTAIMNDAWGAPYRENGFTIAPTDPWTLVAGEYGPGAAHLDDSGTDFASGLSFTAGGTLFDVLSLTFESLGFDFIGRPRQIVGSILLSGFLGGQQVASSQVTMSPISGTFQTVAPGAAFRGIDTFVIELLYPSNVRNCGAPCGHLNLDEVVFSDIAVAPVPLPATGLLLGAGALGLAAFARRRRG